jgi:amidase
MATNWEDRVAPVRGKRDASLLHVEPSLQLSINEWPQNSQPVPRSVLTPREIEITEAYSVKQLLAKLRSREISSEEVTRAFLRRAAVAQACVWTGTRRIYAPADKR